MGPTQLWQVMIVSYETFRLHAERFTAPGTCDLLICDEAHRLKVGAATRLPQPLLYGDDT